MITINTRADLDALQGTKEHEQFMQSLRGTLFIVQKDDELKKWVAVESNDTIEQFGFTRADFEPIEQPSLPEYVFVDYEAQQKVAEAKSYLTSTDWYYPRKLETNKPVPLDVVQKRIEARDLINELEGASPNGN